MSDLDATPGKRDLRPRRRVGHTGRCPRCPRPPIPSPDRRAARDRSAASRRPAAVRGLPGRRLPGHPAGGDAGADRPDVRRHRRLRARPLRDRHARRRAGPAQPGRDPGRAARLVRSGRRARACSTWAGRCETDTALCLADRRSRPLAADEEAGCAGWPATSTWSTSTPTPPSWPSRSPGLRVFAGYAGWSAGQLAGEIAEGAWACVPGRADDVLSGCAGPELWRRSWAGRPAGWPCSRPRRQIRPRTDPPANRLPRVQRERRRIW